MLDKYLKNPYTYYILVPGVAILWLLYTSLIHLPALDKKMEKTIARNTELQKQIEAVLTLDPLRLESKDDKKKDDKFDYSIAIQKAARDWRISASDYDLSVNPTIKRKGRQMQNASLKLNRIDIEQFSNFFSGLLYEWPDLQCETVRLTKSNEGLNSWKAAIKLTYYY